MIAVVGDRETVTGFKLAGIRDCYEANGDNLKNLMDELKDKKVIIINEKLYKIIEDSYPGKIFIQVPDKNGAIGTDDIKKMIRVIAGRNLDI